MFGASVERWTLGETGIPPRFCFSFPRLFSAERVIRHIMKWKMSLSTHPPTPPQPKRSKTWSLLMFLFPANMQNSLTFKMVASTLEPLGGQACVLFFFFCTPCLLNLVSEAGNWKCSPCLVGGCINSCSPTHSVSLLDPFFMETTPPPPFPLMLCDQE